MRFKLEKVKYMPKVLNPETLYVSEEYQTAAHLCACGCGAKIRTPLGITEWMFEDKDEGPSLSPSIGNWQQICQSHYLIDKGNIIWALQWSPAQIAAGRASEEILRKSHYENLYRKDRSLFGRVLLWLKNTFGW